VEPTVDLRDPSLFGNDAAEDEQEEVFSSYALERPEVAEFLDTKQKLCIARAYKGEGKTALLRLTGTKIRHLDSDALVVASTATALAPSLHIDDFSTWVRNWKESILGRLASEIGSRIGHAWTDDAMSLVEEAERTGFRERSIVKAILRRLPIKVDVGPASISVGSVGEPGPSAPAAAVQRWSKNSAPIWLFFDDVDQNFQNTPAQRAKVASFFIACRELINAIPELRIRAAIRPNVWTTIKMEFEALSHVEQYVYDLRWDESSIRQLLAKRIEGALMRSGSWDGFTRTNPVNSWQRERKLIKAVLDDPMSWGKSVRPPHVLLYTLSKHRPRWVIELCKLAGRSAVEAERSRIARDDIFEHLETFGRRRIEDTVSEFRAQCPEVQELIAAFNREGEQFSTAELTTLIKRKILNHVNPQIVGVVAPRPIDVAAFLFQVGFIFGREELPNDEYRHISYSERPHLLSARTSLDEGLSWEIHPVFRQALELRDVAGKELPPPPRGRGRKRGRGGRRRG